MADIVDQVLGLGGVGAEQCDAHPPALPRRYVVEPTAQHGVHVIAFLSEGGSYLGDLPRYHCKELVDTVQGLAARLGLVFADARLHVVKQLSRDAAELTGVDAQVTLSVLQGAREDRINLQLPPDLDRVLLSLGITTY